jgi:hypothetical protein
MAEIERDQGASCDASTLDARELATHPAPGSAPTIAASAEGGAIGGAPSATRERYVARGLLGEGGMGRVEHVFDVDLTRDLAVKRIRPDLARDARVMQQFLWEARVSARLEHPNIVPVHELGVGPDPYFTMKHVRGIALDHALERLAAGDAELSPRLTLPRRLRLFLQIGHAISFAHAQGIAHRDLKPSNVMLGEHGEVLVMDWGLAMPLPGAAGDVVRAALPEGVTAGPSGTPQYMSPEQARGEGVDERSDVYTLGVMLYELAALKRPYDGDTVKDILHKAVTGEHTPLAEAMPGASPSLVAVVERAMALAPSERYPDVRSMVDDLERVIDGRTPEAEHASIVRRAARFYLSRDPALGRLRVVDIDAWACAAALSGVAVGAVAASTLGRFWWAFLVAAIVVATPPTARWLRFLRDARSRHADGDDAGAR